MGSAHFVGRERELIILHQALQQCARAVISSATPGAGGVGKTELAVQYSRRFSKSYPSGICWLWGEGDLTAQILQFAVNHLQIKIPQVWQGKPLSVTEQVAWCWQHWPATGQVLVVIDGLIDWNDTQSLLPTDPRFRLLLTTRNWQQTLDFFELPLDVLLAKEAEDLLKQWVGQRRLQQEHQTAQQLCQDVGHLPLGLEMVGRCLAGDRTLSVNTVQGQLSKFTAESILHQPASALPHRQLYYKLNGTLELVWQRLEPNAIEVALLLALFASAPIPWSLVEQMMQHMGREVEGCQTARQQLESSGFIQPLEGEAIAQRLYAVSPQVQEFLQAKQASLKANTGMALQLAFAAVLAETARQLPQPLTLSTLQSFSLVVPHLKRVAAHLTAYLSDRDFSWVWQSLTRFYLEQEFYELARPWYQDYLKATQTRFGEEHPEVATSLSSLAGFYYAQGHYTEAESYYRRALELYKQTLSAEHPHVAIVLNNLAKLHEIQEQYDMAESLYLQVLELRTKGGTATAADKAIGLNNLAGLYYAQGRYSEAEPLYTQALDIYRRALTPDHPNLVIGLNNLALLYEVQERYAEAERFHLEVLKRHKRVLGENHPEVAASLSDLAGLHELQGQYNEAETLYLQALKLRKAGLGEDHPDVATNLSNLAGVYYAQAYYTEAESLYIEALQHYRQTLGDDHPNVATSLNNLAELYRVQGDYHHAEPLYEQALEICQQRLGDGHPNTMMVRQSLDLLRRKMQPSGSRVLSWLQRS
jgi:tetratricopeptide (TPR) repeat protein